MRGALVVALTLTLWSCAPGHGGKYPLVEKYNWAGKIDGSRKIDALWKNNDNKVDRDLTQLIL